MLMSSVPHLYKKRAFRLYKIDIAISERLYDTQEIFKQQFGEDHVDFDIFEGEEDKKQEQQYFTFYSVKKDFSEYYRNFNHNIIVKNSPITI